MDLGDTGSERKGTPGPATSIYLWGAHRSELNTTARALAARLDPRFHWVEAASADSRAVEGPPRGELSVVCPARELVPKPGLPPEVLWTQLRPHGQRRAVAELQDFLRIPEPIQASVASLLGSDGPRPRVLVLANVDLVSEFDHYREKFVGDFIEFLNSHDISLLVTSTGRPLLERIDFEYSLTLSDSLPGRFAVPGAVCQWGDCTACFVKGFPPDELTCLAQLANSPRVSSVRGNSLAGFASH
jgi:hypothetical protein